MVCFNKAITVKARQAVIHGTKILLLCCTVCTNVPVPANLVI